MDLYYAPDEMEVGESPRDIGNAFAVAVYRAADVRELARRVRPYVEAEYSGAKTDRETQEVLAELDSILGE